MNYETSPLKRWLHAHGWLYASVLGFLFFLVATSFNRGDHPAWSISNSTNASTTSNETIAANKEPYPKSITRDGPHDEYLAICLFARDQALDMVEWFQHHYHEMGVRRFYVMDDGSDPPLSTFQDQYGIPTDAIDFHYHEKTNEEPQRVQLQMYDLCGTKYGVNNTWIAFIDADEYFDVGPNETIEGILKEFHETRPEAGVLSVNWQVHTSNNQLHRAKSTRQTYLQCVSDGADKMGMPGDPGVGSNAQTKSIARVDVYSAPTKSIHQMSVKEGFIPIGEKGDQTGWLRRPVTRDRIGLHHYQVKSFEDYYDKMTRSEKGWGFWDLIEYNTPHVACPDMLKYFPKPVNQPGVLDLRHDQEL